MKVLHKEKPIICIPENDPLKRFLLGIQGSKELLAIGLNPSTANEESLDPTSINIQTIANNHDCDGWWLINLYPLRTSKPKKLHKQGDQNLFALNLEQIEKICSDPKYNITKVLCCWGNNVEKFIYLKDYADQIMQVLMKYDKPTYCIKLTGSGNPFHPAPTPVNRFLGGIHNVTLKPYEF